MLPGLLTRGPDSRQGYILVLTLLFVIGLAFGLLFNWGRQQMASSATAEEEYVALVARLYEREHLIENAHQRLALLGTENVATRVEIIFEEFQDKSPRRQSALDSMQRLTQDLRESGATQPPLSSPTNPPLDTAGTDWVTVALILVIIGVVVIGGIMGMQSIQARRGQRQSKHRFTRSTAQSVAKKAPRPGQAWRQVAEVTLDDGTSEVVSAPRPLEVNPVLDSPSEAADIVSEPRPLTGESAGVARPVQPPTVEVSDSLFSAVVSEPRPLVTSDDEALSSASNAAHEDLASSAQPSAPDLLNLTNEGQSSDLDIGADQAKSASSTQVGRLGRRRRNTEGISRGKSPAFRCHYQRGDDPYDAAHAIVHPVSRVALGACGMSSALYLDETDECYAFTIWIHDYLANDEIASLGLISKWSEEEKSPRLRAWTAREHLQRIVVATEGQSLLLETTNLRTLVSLDSFDYWEAPGVPKCSSFAHLAITFRVTPKQ